MPIEFLYTDSEILKIRTKLLKKMVLSTKEIETLKEINEYCKKTK